MKIVVVEQHKPAYIREVCEKAVNDCRVYEKIIGDWWTEQPMPDGASVILKAEKQLSPRFKSKINRVLRKDGQPIGTVSGTFVIVGCSNGWLTGLTDEQVTTYLAAFAVPDIVTDPKRGVRPMTEDELRLVSNKKTNMHYWDEIDGAVEDMVQAIASMSLIPSSLRDDALLEIVKPLVDETVQALRQRGCVFPFVDENY